MSRAGQFVKQLEGYRAFEPAPLPPVPPLTYDPWLCSPAPTLHRTRMLSRPRSGNRNDELLPWRVPIGSQGKKGMVVLDQIRTADKRRLVKNVGSRQSTGRQAIDQVKRVIGEMLVD
jgi:mRNA-degrading endonuclease toxin of MazEF toxin-antitoxin module